MFALFPNTSRLLAEHISFALKGEAIFHSIFYRVSRKKRYLPNASSELRCHIHLDQTRSDRRMKAEDRVIPPVEGENEASQPVPFKFTDYDFIGFDLDNTLARYKLGPMITLEYEIMSKYLVKNKHYLASYLMKPLDHTFLLKGLIVDDVHGNLLRIDPTGMIIMASHGTKLMTDEEIGETYLNNHWEGTDAFVENPINIWNSHYSVRMRTLLDYYDIAVAALFARAVDSIDETRGRQLPYNIWPDILDALVYMFNRAHFRAGIGEYFPALTAHPEQYYHRCSDVLISWLKQLKASGKMTFMVTGSNVDFATHTALNTLGPEWRSLFDIVVCYARKPGFFTEKRKFVSLVDGIESGHINNVRDMVLGEVYNQGNWVELCEFFKLHKDVPNPRFLYVGDNLIQDIYTPSVYTNNCDTVAICEELEAEGSHGYQQWHPDEEFLVSSTWGSYFHGKTSDQITNWNHIIKNHSKMCVPSVEYVAQFAIDNAFKPNPLP